jgi:hypothetical protein
VRLVTIGGSIGLIIIGAILRFGITWKPQNVDLQVIGLILMIAGAAGLVIALVLLATRRRGRRGTTQVYEERRYTEPPSFDERRYAGPPASLEERRYTDAPPTLEERSSTEPPA